jgi:hypothetical protein
VRAESALSARLQQLSLFYKSAVSASNSNLHSRSALSIFSLSMHRGFIAASSGLTPKKVQT